ncbi:MAG: phospholipase D family protein [Planctomycetota bacterium]
MVRVAFALVLLLVVGCRNVPPPVAQRANDIAVYFSPDGGATDAIVAEIGQAEQTLDVAAYSFTSAPIAGAVRNAHRRGVAVRVVLNRDQERHRYSSGNFLANAGIPVHVRVGDGVQHSKYMIIDGRTVITGSFNFSRRAEERNAENLLVLRRVDVAETYGGNFEAMLRSSRPFEDKRGGVSE